MSTDHDFSPQNSAYDAPAVQSGRKVPWSDIANSASAGHELPAYTALYGQLGDEELVIRPSGEPENDAEKLEKPTSSGNPAKSPEKAHDSVEVSAAKPLGLENLKIFYVLRIALAYIPIVVIAYSWINSMARYSTSYREETSVNLLSVERPLSHIAILGFLMIPYAVYITAVQTRACAKFIRHKDYPWVEKVNNYGLVFSFVMTLITVAYDNPFGCLMVLFDLGVSIVFVKMMGSGTAKTKPAARPLNIANLDSKESSNNSLSDEEAEK